MSLLPKRMSRLRLRYLRRKSLLWTFACVRARDTAVLRISSTMTWISASLFLFWSSSHFLIRLSVSASSPSLFLARSSISCINLSILSPLKFKESKDDEEGTKDDEEDKEQEETLGKCCRGERLPNMAFLKNSRQSKHIGTRALAPGTWHLSQNGYGKTVSGLN